MSLIFSMKTEQFNIRICFVNIQTVKVFYKSNWYKYPEYVNHRAHSSPSRVHSFLIGLYIQA